MDISDFISKKLDDICNHVNIFYKYISIKREGFLNPINYIIEKDTEKKTEYSDYVYKTVNSKMIEYIINSIYNCNNYKDYKIQIELDSEKVKNKLLNTINEQIKIEYNAILLIIKYINYCVINITSISKDSFSKNYNKIIKNVADNKRDYDDFNLDNELSKMALQSIFHISLSFLDWLELNVMSENELEKTIEFLLTKSLYPRYKIIYNKHLEILKQKLNTEEFLVKFNILCVNVFELYKKYGIYVSSEMCNQISYNVLCLSNYENLDKEIPNPKKLKVKRIK